MRTLHLGLRVADGSRIDLVQWPAGHPNGMTEADFSDQIARD
jgi:hypothetical protein